MKRFLIILGWLSFIMFSFDLYMEYYGMDMYDTCLFSLGGESVGYGGVIDLSPIFMFIVYLICFAVSLTAAVKSNDNYLYINISNLILRVIVFITMFYRDSVVFPSAFHKIFYFYGIVGPILGIIAVICKIKERKSNK